jgi:2-(1,2-epoxy-1,2-dihydrophenyl)acetyl-CoA isomerase
MTYESLSLDIGEDGVAAITLAQPDRGNPFDLRLCTELGHVASAIDEDPRVRAVLLQAAGRFFSVGGDLGSLGADRAALPSFIKEATAGFHAAVSRFGRMDAPVVSSVHGVAAGGGVSLAAAADFCLAGRSAAFVAAYQGIGLAIDGGGSYTVPRRVGPQRARAFYLRHQTWPAEQALAYGLVDEVHEDDALPAAARSLAAELAEGPIEAYGEVKNLLLSTSDQSLEGQLELEARAMVRSARTDAAWDAIQAMVAKTRR